MEQKEEEKLLKEIADIEHEQKNIMRLLSENNMQKLNDFLEGELTEKYRVEKTIHNMLSSSMPSNIQESANNAFNFLENIKREKEAKLVYKISSSDK